MTKSVREQVEITVVSSSEGPSLYVNSLRVLGPKPWGGGKIVYGWKDRRSDLLDSLKEAGLFAEDTASRCAALQQENERLRGEIERVANGANAGLEDGGLPNAIVLMNVIGALRRALSPQPGPRDSIRLQCPHCGTTTTAARRDWDPVHAVLCCVYCPDCVSGGFGEYVTYYDAKGSEITDPPGGSDVLDM